MKTDAFSSLLLKLVCCDQFFWSTYEYMKKKFSLTQTCVGRRRTSQPPGKGLGGAQEASDHTLRTTGPGDLSNPNPDSHFPWLSGSLTGGLDLCFLIQERLNLYFRHQRIKARETIVSALKGTVPVLSCSRILSEPTMCHWLYLMLL